MNLVEKAYTELFEKEISKECVLKYSGRFKGYNANIRMDRDEILVNMSKQWRGVSKEIQKGLIQELLARLFKSKRHTIHIDLYHSFIKNMSNFAPKVHTHPVLQESFSRVNEMLFNGMMQEPNLKIGNGINKLGTYEYATNTITISKILLQDETLMDYVMYHEMLHKKHKYKAGRRRTLYHSKAFKEDERKFPNAELLEKDLSKLVRKKKMFSWW